MPEPLHGLPRGFAPENDEGGANRPRLPIFRSGVMFHSLTVPPGIPFGRLVTLARQIIQQGAIPKHAAFVSVFAEFLGERFG